MSCVKPLHGFQVGVHEKTGRPRYKITSADYTRIVYDGQEYTEYIELPCGKCLGCKLDYSRQWADRCLLEMQYHEQNTFVTLTYDDDHLPMVTWKDDVDDSWRSSASLHRRDVQLFLKRLRKKYGNGIRFFGSGEYGDSTMRPHYHLILFGFSPPDLVEFGKSKLGDTYYRSDSLTELWSAGHVLVAKVTWKSCAYVARYVTKKISSYRDEAYAELGLVPPFSMMSRRPGIGRKYFDEHDVFAYDSIQVSTEDGGRTIYPPRYFYHLLEQTDPERYAQLKELKRQIAADLAEQRDWQTDLNRASYLRVQEQKLANIDKKLIRRFQDA